MGDHCLWRLKNIIPSRFCGGVLKLVNKVKHLGHVLTNCKNIFDPSSMISDVKIRTNGILCNFNFLSVDARVKIFNTNCSSYYGSQLMNLQSSNINTLNIAWRVSSRRILGVSSRTHSNLLPPLMSANSPGTEISSRIFSFFRKGFYHHSQIISFYFRNCFMLSSSIIYNNLSYMLKEIEESVELLMCNVRRVKHIKMRLKTKYKWEDMVRVKLIK